MKITILTSPFGGLPPVSIGAVEKLFYELAQFWCKAGHSVVFYSISGGNENDYNCDVKYLPGWRRSGSLIVDLVKDFSYSLRFCFRLKKTDILILNTFWSPYLIQFFRRKVKKVIYGVHRFPKRQFGLYSKIDYFVCVSTAVYDKLIQIHPKYLEKSCVISNPVDTNIFSPKRWERTDCIEIIYAGRIHPEKGLEILAKAYALLKKKHPCVSLTFIGGWTIFDGGGGKNYRKKLKNIAPDIRYVKSIYNQKQLAGRLAKGDIFVYPSVAEWGESFGLAPLEAMACGLPTVVSDLKCFADYGEPENNILIFKRGESQVDDLVRQLERLVVNEDLRQRLSANAVITAKRFDLPIIANKYLALFEELMR